MFPLRSITLLLCTVTLALAETDPAALQKQQQDIDRRERRDQQKIDQAEEQERIKLRARERDENARLQREYTVDYGAAVAAAAAGNKTAALFDPAKLTQAKFEQDEVQNMLVNQLGAEITNRFNKERAVLSRKYSLERAKLDAQQIDAGDDSAKQRDTANKSAEINAKYQEKLDDLAFESATAEAKLRFSHTTKINSAEREINLLTTKHLVEQSQKGNAAVYNPTADPQYAKLAAARDDAKNALDTALEESRASFNVKRTDIENAKEDELAKLNG